MTEQYLILHKVRGEPSFDCAEQMEVDGEVWWITNSGHRAYPYWHAPLNLLMDAYKMPILAVPADWPDHFQVEGEKPPPTFNIMTAIQGLLPKINRRVR